MSVFYDKFYDVATVERQILDLPPCHVLFKCCKVSGTALQSSVRLVLLVIPQHSGMVRVTSTIANTSCEFGVDMLVTCAHPSVYTTAFTFL